jgi:hypothetical protein
MSAATARVCLASLLIVVAVGVRGSLARAQGEFPSGVTVSVGYVDNQRPSGFFPTPWLGDSGVIFNGCAGPCAFDGGAIKVTNNSATTVTVNGLQVE